MKQTYLSRLCHLAVGAATAAPFLPLSLGAASLVTSATPVESLFVKEGFKVELLYSVPKDQQGSWVSMTVDPKGRLIVCDQYGGLYRVTPPALGGCADQTKIEPIPLEIGQAQGLLYAHNSLYIVVNGDPPPGRGLYRATDTNGDDMLDKVVLLKKFEESGGEHGPHAVILGPDKESIYVVVGNQTALPAYDHSRVPPFWGEDLLLPRVYGNGFMKGILAPRGWIAKTDSEGKNWEIIATGFRNEYDADFNLDGELFTYDADMEWDVNAPWYRPTRVNHVVSGAEFGWRNGSGKWPAYYPDSLPATVNIGPGSPTGVVFGTGANFPTRYQQAFFICDWSYGKLYAVHLSPKGSTYTAEFEEFITGQPLPLTDILVNPADQAMYFTIGGRKTQSGLYRVTYTGPDSREAPKPNTIGSYDRRLRHWLEQKHQKGDARTLDEIWPHLSHPDRFIRSAARVALEHQPAERWQDRALREPEPQASIEALLALSRVGNASLQSHLIQSLQKLDWEALSNDQKIAVTRVYSLAFIRMGEPTESMRQKLIPYFDSLFPAHQADLTNELCQLLAYLQSPSIVAKTVDLLEIAPTQEQQVHFAKTIRLVKTGWTPTLRQRYFQWFIKAASYRGGASFSKFIQSIKNDAIEGLTETEKEELKPILEAQPEIKSPFEQIAARSFVKEWTLNDLATVTSNPLTGRNLERGRQIFGQAACFACHRFGLEGGALGPDLTSAGGRFNPRDLLESIIQPSKEISDQYAPIEITLNDGDIITGRVVNLFEDTLLVNPSMLDPNNMIGVDRKKVKSITPSKTSMMPEGLLNTFSQEEILDLLAFVLGGAR